MGGLKNKQKQKSLISIPTCAGTDPVGGLQPVWGVPHGSGAWDERLCMCFLGIRGCVCFLGIIGCVFVLGIRGCVFFYIFRDEKLCVCF